MKPWNDWYHCMGNTYGTWLPGEPRGFRTRHHREHIAGDYRSPPPPDRYLERHRKSQSLLKRLPIYLTSTQRQLAVQEFTGSPLRRGIQVIAVSIDRIHLLRNSLPAS